MVTMARLANIGSNWYLGGNSHTPGDQLSAGRVVGRHHAKLACIDELVECSKLLLEAGLILVGGRVRVGGLGASICVGKGGHVSDL